MLPTFFFTEGLSVNASAYSEALDKVVKPWVTTIARGRLYANDSNRHPHNTVEAIKAQIVASMGNIPKTHLITACSRFRRHIEAVIASDGGFIE